MIKKLNRLKLFCLVLLTSSASFGQESLPLIPQPQTVKVSQGNFILNEGLEVSFSETAEFEANYFIQEVNERCGITLEKSAKQNAKAIQLNIIIPDTLLPLGTYTLSIEDDNIIISSPTNTGLFYGVQTLLQLIPFKKTAEVTLPHVQIYDTPKYAWRGMHLDVGRHFFSVEFIKRYIDYLAMYKMNTFHWHLTEDQGWRIEIKKYPLLTEVGAWRNGTMVGHYNDQYIDTVRYGGFYTQDEIREVVQYASERHITVVPEIEMPGHSLAALSSYPHLSCTGGPFEVGKIWGVYDDVYCTKEETFEFLENVLLEVMQLFPSKYIHIGGDECPKKRWENCSTCQQTIKREGLKDEHELQSYFITRIEKFLNAHGRQIIGWDEILEGGLAPNAAVMSWRGTEGGIAAARQHHPVVMSPGSHCYFDHYQAKPESEEPLAIGGYTTTEKVYSFNPMPSDLSDDEAKYIMGAQGNVWTEYMRTSDHVEYMVFPRMTALSEVLWGTADPSQYDDFFKRLTFHFKTFDSLGINYKKITR